MVAKKEQAVIAEIREFLTQVALELESSAAGAREAAKSLPDRAAAWPSVQKMYSRLMEANQLLDKFQHMIDELGKTGATRQNRK